MRETAKNIISAFKTSSVRVKLLVWSAVIVLFVSTMCNMLNITFAYRVTYNDDVVGFVSSAEELEEVKQDVVSEIKTSNADSYVGTTGITLSVAFGGDIESSAQLADKILSSSDELTKAAVLVVDGQTVCAVKPQSAAALWAVLDAHKAKYATGVDDSVYFVKDVTVVEGYYPASGIKTAEAAEDFVSTLEVVTVNTKTYNDSIPFEVIKKESGGYLEGYRRVTKKGIEGTKSVTATITCVNGVETERVILEETVISSPSPQEEIVGTAVVDKKTGNVTGSAQGIFSWPLQRVSGQRITSYWGDGRGHKAIDIASKKGTKIYAAMGGTVVLATYKSDYGYHVIIDHGDGYSTLYAHASKLNVKVGDVVNTGDVIAFVGSTGQSTGPHLHFEVRIDGVRVNPMGYIKQ